MNKGRALQSVIGALTGQTVPRDAAKFFINKGDEGLPGRCIPMAPLQEQLRDAARRRGTHDGRSARGTISDHAKTIPLAAESQSTDRA